MNSATELPTITSARNSWSHMSLGLHTLSDTAMSEFMPQDNDQAEPHLRSSGRSRRLDIEKSTVNDQLSLSSPRIRTRLRFGDKETVVIDNCLNLEHHSSKRHQMTRNTLRETILESVFGESQHTNASVATDPDMGPSHTRDSNSSGECHSFSPGVVQRDQDNGQSPDRHVSHSALRSARSGRNITPTRATFGRNSTSSSSSRAHKATPSHSKGCDTTPGSAKRSIKTTPRRLAQDGSSLTGSVMWWSRFHENRVT